MKKTIWSIFNEEKISLNYNIVKEVTDGNLYKIQNESNYCICYDYFTVSEEEATLEYLKNYLKVHDLNTKLGCQKGKLRPDTVKSINKFMKKLNKKIEQKKFEEKNGNKYGDKDYIILNNDKVAISIMYNYENKEYPLDISIDIDIDKLIDEIINNINGVDELRTKIKTWILDIYPGIMPNEIDRRLEKDLLKSFKQILM